MSLRATSVKKYDVEYGNHQGFNYDPEGLYGIISEFCEDFYCGEFADTDVIWEVSASEFKKMVEKIKALSDEDYAELVGGERDEVVSFLEGCLSDTPEDDCYVRIAWV